MSDSAFLRPHDIGLILSYQCQSRCAHCIYNCESGWKEWIEPSGIRSALQAIASYGQPMQVHLTGGEPFLKFPLLLSAVQAAGELGLSSYLETNGGWCFKEEDVIQKYSALQQAGLQAILISCSPFHAEYIPLERTLMAIRFAQAIFGSEQVMVYLPDWLDILLPFGLDRPIPLQKLEETWGLGKTMHLLWDGYGLISGGRAGYRLKRYSRKRPATDFEGQNCRADLLYGRHSHFDLYGNYLPAFCGGISLGDWHDLPALRQRYQNGLIPPLIHLLLEGGPYQLYRYAVQEWGYQPPQDGFSGKCHLCADVRTHLFQQQRFPELAPVGFYEFSGAGSRS